MTTDLSGRVAIVTGCGKRDGIGASVARMLAALGASVVVTDRPAPDGKKTDQLDELAAGLDSAKGGLAIRADVTSEADCAIVASTTVKRFGRVDILVNNAGADHGADRRPIAEIAYADWQRVLNVNLTGGFLMARACVPTMVSQGWGRIIGISSISATRGFIHRIPYSASKAGVLGLTHALAAEMAPHGVTVNAICPGPVETARARSTAALQGGPASVEETLRKTAQTVPVKRMGRPADVANAVCFFASPLSDFVTGQVMTVDGGISLVIGKQA